MSEIVVTGVGAISPVGGTAISSFEALMHGKSGVKEVSFPLDDRFDVRIGAQIDEVDASAILGERESRHHGRVTQLAAIAAAEAVAQSGLRDARYEASRIATIIGVGMGGIEAVCHSLDVLERHGPQRVPPFGMIAAIPNMPAGVIASLVNAQGPCYCTASACASSGHAIGDAFHLLQRGEVDAAICGGAEACILPITIANFSRMGALSKRNHAPEQASRPFDAERDGFVLAEGGAVLVLEREDRARRRGAPILGRLCGYGATADAFHPTRPAPDGRGLVAAMRRALEGARIDGSEVDYINAHGTGTRYNDLAETNAIKTVFGEHGFRVPVSSTKSMTGHMLGGAGAFEAIVALQALQSSLVPPTINLDTADEACDLDFVPHTGREVPVRYAMSNSCGFGGQNVSLLFGAVN